MISQLEKTNSEYREKSQEMEDTIKDMELEFKTLKNDLKRQENVGKAAKGDIEKDYIVSKQRVEDLEEIMKTLREELKDRGIELERLRGERVKDEEQVRTYEREKNQVEYDLGNKILISENDTMKLRIDNKDLKVKYNKLEEKWVNDKDLYTSQIHDLKKNMSEYREKAQKQIDQLKDAKATLERDIKILSGSVQEFEIRKEKLVKENDKNSKLFEEKETLLSSCMGFIEDLYGLCRKEKNLAQYLKSFQFKKNQIEKKFKALKNPSSDYFNKSQNKISGNITHGTRISYSKDKKSTTSATNKFGVANNRLKKKVNSKRNSRANSKDNSKIDYLSDHSLEAEACRIVENYNRRSRDKSVNRNVSKNNTKNRSNSKKRPNSKDNKNCLVYQNNDDFFSVAKSERYRKSSAKKKVQKSYQTTTEVDSEIDSRLNDRSSLGFNNEFNFETRQSKNIRHNDQSKNSFKNEIDEQPSHHTNNSSTLHYSNTQFNQDQRNIDNPYKTSRAENTKFDDSKTKIHLLEDEIIKLKKEYQEKLADQPIEMNIENIGALRQGLNQLASQIQQKSESLLESKKWHRENEEKKRTFR